MPNHPPSPVLNVLDAPLPGSEECKKLKSDHGIVARQHCEGSPKSSGMESHHILQDKAMVGLISKRSGWAVLLDGSAGGPHKQINTLQTNRNCGPNPPTTFGELVKASRDDLETMFKANGKSAPVAKKLANCLTIEAVEKTQEKRRKRKPRKPPLTRNSRVKKVKGCLAAHTWVWLADGSRVPAAAIRAGMRVAGAGVVRRVDGCTSSVVQLFTETGTLELTASHALCLSDGRVLRAGRVRVGHVLASLTGGSRVLAVRRPHQAQAVVSFDFGVPADMPIGISGVLAHMPVLGPAPREIVWLTGGADAAA